MRENVVNSFFAVEPQVHPKSLALVGRSVAAGLELGEYRYLRGGRLRIVKKIAQTLVFNSALLDIEIPPVGHDMGYVYDGLGNREDHYAHLGSIDGKAGIIFSDLYLRALITPDRYGRDMDWRGETIQSVTAHECFHIKQLFDFPWKLKQDAAKHSISSELWETTRTEIGAQRYACVYEAERTRLARERNTRLFLENMGIDPTGIIDQSDQVAAVASLVVKK